MSKEEKLVEGRLIIVIAVTMMLTTACIFFAFFATKNALMQSGSFGDRSGSVVRKGFPQGLSIVRLDESHVCYLLPYELREEVPYEAQPLIVKEESLGYDEVEALAGEDAALLCAGRRTRIVRPVKEEELTGKAYSDSKIQNPVRRSEDRIKRQAKDGYPSSGIFATAIDRGKPAIEIDIEERQPRCVNVLLDCFNHVGQVQLCYTWQNGAMFMERKCLDKNKFEMKMTKPPGRILKVAQQQLVLCLERKEKGLQC